MKIHVNNELNDVIKFSLRPNLAFYGLLYLLLLIILFPVSVNANNLQSKLLTIHHENVPLSLIITDIEKKSGYSVIVRLNDIDIREKYSINEVNKSVKQILAILFDGKNIDYELKGNTISIFKSQKSTGDISSSAKRAVTGIVTDEYGAPVIGASVIEKGTTNGVITNIDGEFDILTSTNGKLSVSYLGYVSQKSL